MREPVILLSKNLLLTLQKKVWIPLSWKLDTLSQHLSNSQQMQISFL